MLAPFPFFAEGDTGRNRLRLMDSGACGIPGCWWSVAVRERVAIASTAILPGVYGARYLSYRSGMDINSILVTGSNRGLGLEWVRQYARLGWRVYATCRFLEQAGELHKLASDHPNISLHPLDVTRSEQIAALARELNDVAIDILVNNAGVYYERWGKDKLGSIDYDDWQQTFAVNVLGAMRVSEALLDSVARSRRRLLVGISSHMGSITDIGSGNNYAYRSSKAALNAAMTGLAHEVAPRKVGVLLLHPGWVQTRMGGDSAPYTPAESVQGMRQIIDDFTLEQSGVFLRFDGTRMPW